MASRRLIKIFFMLLPFILATNCYSFIFSVKVYQRADGATIFIGLDDHELADKNQNQQQLQFFVKNVLGAATTPIHLMLESKFFYGFEGDSTSHLKFLSQKFSLPENHTPWSFAYSPQAKNDTTWIGWDLPFGLFCTPDSFGLNQEQVTRITKNVRVRFFDPRLLLDPKLQNPYSADFMIDAICTRLRNLINQSDNKDYLQEAITKCYNNQDGDNLNPPELFDYECLISLIEQFDTTNRTDIALQKTIILCGSWHAHNLGQVLPALGFKLVRTTGIDQNSVTLRKLKAPSADQQMSPERIQSSCQMLQVMTLDPRKKRANPTNRKLNFDGDDSELISKNEMDIEFLVTDFQ